MARGYLFKSQSTSSLNSQFDSMENEIREKGISYILSVDHDEWLQYFKAKLLIKNLCAYTDQTNVKFLGKIALKFQHNKSTPMYKFIIEVPFIGEQALLFYKVSKRLKGSFNVETLSKNGVGSIEHSILMENEDAALFNEKKIAFLYYLTKGIQILNQDILEINSLLEPRFWATIKKLTDDHNKESKFLKEIGIEINQKTTTVFQIPKIEEVVQKEPMLVKDAGSGVISKIPVVSMNFYNDVCEIINRTFKAIEKKPSIYKVRNEEELRDYILPILEVRYLKTTVTGETFNKLGKTDLLIRDTEGSNLFVAEFKFWHGSKKTKDALTQLFDLYLTWRDSKVALVLFIQEQGFSKIVEKVNTSIQDHEYFISFEKQEDDTTFLYKMRLKDDSKKIVYLKVMCFNFVS